MLCALAVLELHIDDLASHRQTHRCTRRFRPGMVQCLKQYWSSWTDSYLIYRKQ